MNLIEKYNSRLNVSEEVYRREHDGEGLDFHRKSVIARVLENTNQFLKESFEGAGTQRSDLGNWKQFTLNITDVVLPNLIVNDLMLVQPMTAATGQVAYLNYVAGSTKSGVNKGDLFNGVYKMGTMDANRANYTSERCVDTFTTFTSGTSKVSWGPVVAGTIRALDANGSEVSDNATAWTADDDGVITAGAYKTGKSATDVKKIAYCYDNEMIPGNDVPMLNAALDHVALVAKVRKIQTVYSNLAAFQAKTDYGFDLGAGLAEQAKAELMNEIDGEGVLLLAQAAESDSTLVWSKTLPVGVSKFEHYAGFSEILELAKMIIYRRTLKFSANWLLVSPEVIPVISLIPGWKADSNAHIAGPYKAGSINGLKVYVTPILTNGKWVCGVNGNDLKSAPAIYAPYLAIMPTQLLGFADQSMSQGFATMYDMKLLSTYPKDDATDEGVMIDGHKCFSYLLVKGQITA